MILKSSYGYNIELTWRKLEEHLFTRVVRNEQLQHAPPMSNKLRYHFAILLAPYMSPGVTLRQKVRRSHFKQRTSEIGAERDARSVQVPAPAAFLYRQYWIIIGSIFTPVFGHSWAMSLCCWDMLALCWAIYRYMFFFLRVQDKRVHLAPGAGCQMNRLILGPLRESWLYFFTLFCHVQPRCEKPYLEINSR